MLFRMLAWYMVMFAVSQASLLVLWLNGKVNWPMWLILSPFEITVILCALILALFWLALLGDSEQTERPWVIRNRVHPDLFWSTELEGWSKLANADLFPAPSYDENFPMPWDGEWYFTGADEQEKANEGRNYAERERSA
jgi:hypothetical protein